VLTPLRSSVSHNVPQIYFKPIPHTILPLHGPQILHHAHHPIRTMLWKCPCDHFLASTETEMNATSDILCHCTESRRDIQVELDRLDQFRISDRCYTTTFSTCSGLSTTLNLGAIQTPAPPLPPSTSGVGGPPLISTTYGEYVPLHCTV